MLNEPRLSSFFGGTRKEVVALDCSDTYVFEVVLWVVTDCASCVFFLPIIFLDSSIAKICFLLVMLKILLCQWMLKDVILLACDVWF